MTNPILTIARFECRYQFRQPVFYLFTLLSFGQGIWYVNQIESQYAYADPAITTYLVLASLGSSLAISVVLLAGQSLTKDLDFRTAAYLYSLPITSRMHFAGRFVGIFGSAVLIAGFYPLGIAAYFVSTATAVPWLSVLDGFVRLVIQNVLVVSSITFALTVWLRSLRGAYISLFLVVLYFLLAESTAGDAAPADLWQLLDPFGVEMARESAGAMLSADDPTGFVAFTDLFVVNRILWLGFALGLLTHAESHFSFAYFTTQPASSVRKNPSSYRLEPVSVGWPPLPTRFSSRTTPTTVFRLIHWELRSLVKQPLFSITAVLLVGLTVLLATVLRVTPDFPALPTTAQMTAQRLPMNLFIGAFLLVMTTESLFRERDTGFWSIHDVLPRNNAVLLLPRLGALMLVAAVFTFILFLTCVGVQVNYSFTDFDWHWYANDLLGDGFSQYCQLIMLGAFVSGMVNDRLRSHLVNLLLFGLLVYIDHQSADTLPWLAYSFLPGSATYSDLIGYGSATQLRLPVQLLWWSIGLLLTPAFLITWNRGVRTPFTRRLAQWRTQIDLPYQLMFAGAILSITLAIWQVRAGQSESATSPPIRYAIRTVQVKSVSGHTIGLHVQYHHPYQIQHMVRATTAALTVGEKLFGAYPFSDLWITETPIRQFNDVSTPGASTPGASTPGASTPGASAPGHIWLDENQGWTADAQQPGKTDYVDYVLSREVFRQWLAHRLHSANRPGSGFIETSLAEYLALQRVRECYGDNRLRDRLAQRAIAYARSRRNHRTTVASPVESSDDDATDRYRTPSLLASIGQVWGDKPLSYTISQFYRESISQPKSATAAGFSSKLARNLPDSLAYLQSYLTDRLEFDLKIGRIAKLATGTRVDLLVSKWREGAHRQRYPLPFTDYVPLVVLDANDRPIYRLLVHPDSDHPFVVLPALADARKVVIDFLGTWPEPTNRDNAKLL